MSNINELIKELRNKTGAGFLDCKTSLAENDNDIEKAIEFLRKKGLAKASKKSSREANEGAVGFYSNSNLAILIKVNSETDFAAKSETFLNFLDDLGKTALELNNAKLNLDEFLKTNFKEGTVSDYFKAMIAKIGENLILSEIIVIDNKNLNHSYYVHNSYKENIGKIISLINFTSDKIDDKINNLSKNICMHIAAMKPESLNIEDLDINIIENEKRIQKELILSSGKPENIVDKILEGKMKKFFADITLFNQTYILDSEKTIDDVIKEFSDEYNFNLISFKLLSL